MVAITPKKLLLMARDAETPQDVFDLVLKYVEHETNIDIRTDTMRHLLEVWQEANRWGDGLRKELQARYDDETYWLKIDLSTLRDSVRDPSNYESAGARLDKIIEKIS